MGEITRKGGVIQKQLKTPVALCSFFLVPSITVAWRNREDSFNGSLQQCVKERAEGIHRMLFRLVVPLGLNLFWVTRK